MRNKLLALILALTMVVGLAAMTPAAVAAEGVKTIGRDVVLEAAELLVTLNIVQGYEDGTLGLEKNITRAELANNIARMLQGTDELNLNAGAIVNTKMSETPENIAALKAAQEAETAFAGATGSSKVSVGSRSYHTDIDSTDLADPSFNDISELHWAYNDVEYLRGQGIVTGYSDGSFKPDNNILYEEAVKFVVSALGYDFMAVTYGGYPEGYIKSANQLKILKNVNGANGVAATRQQIMVLLYNSLTADYLVLDSVDGMYNVYDTGKNILKHVFGIDRIEGTINATEVSGIKSAYDATDKGTVEIGENTMTGGPVFKIFNDSYKDYLGYNVKAYVRYEDENPSTNRGELYCMFPYQYTKTITVKNEDIAYSDILTKQIAGVYVDEDEVELDFEAGLNERDIIYNGIAYTKSSLDKDLENLGAGEVTFVSRDGDKKYDLIIINEYMPMYVETVKSSEKSIFGTKLEKNGQLVEGTLYLDTEEKVNGYDITVDIIKADGTKGEFSDIKSDSVIHIRKWGTHYTINLGGTLVSGEVARKGSGYVIIGDNRYEAKKGSDVLDSYKPGTVLKVGLDKDGYIFYAKAQKGIGALNYGLLMDVAVDDTKGFDTILQFKLMDSSGKKAIYTAAENMKFTHMGKTTYRYNDEGKSTSITASEMFGKLVETAKFASLQYGTGYAAKAAARPYEQLIKYSLNSAGEISEIITAMASSQVPEDMDKSAYFTFEEVNVSGGNYHINAGSIYGTPYTVNGSLFFFASGSTAPEDDEYRVGKWGAGARSSAHGHVLFDVAEDGTVGAVITYNDSNKKESNNGDENKNYAMIEFETDEVVEFEDELYDGYEIGYISDGTYGTVNALGKGNAYPYKIVSDYYTGDVINPRWWTGNGNKLWRDHVITVFDSITTSAGEVKDTNKTEIEGDSSKTVYMGYYPISAILSRIIDGTPAMYFHAVDGSSSWGKFEREVTFGKVRSVANGKVIVEYGEGAAQATVCTISGKKAARYDCETGYVSAVDATDVAEGDWALLQMSNKEFKSLAFYTNVDEASLSKIQREENERD